jgi:RNA polymerase sigma-70 factor (ECF subfamily)
MNVETQLPSDEALATAAQKGDLESFEALVARHAPRLLGFLCRKVRSRHEAEDLAQQVWIAVYRQLARYDATRPFRPWLFTIARRAAITAWRRSKGEAAELEEHHLVDRRHPGAASAQLEENEGIWAWVRTELSGEQSDALWLMYKQEMSVADIAQTLECSVVRVKVMMHRARKKLAAAFAERPSGAVADAVQAWGSSGDRP